MHLLISYLLLISLNALLSRASPLANLILPSNSSSPGATEYLTNHVPELVARPNEVTNLIYDYNVEVSGSNPLDPGSGGSEEPNKFQDALVMITAWAQAQSYTSRTRIINYSGAATGSTFVFAAEGYTYSLDLAQVLVGMEGIRRYATMSRAKCPSTITWTTYTQDRIASSGTFTFI